MLFYLKLETNRIRHGKLNILWSNIQNNEGFETE